MKYLPVFILYLMLGGNLAAQSISPQVVAATGTVFSQGGYTIEFTSGELCVTSLTSPADIITQGFHQTYAGPNTSGIEANPEIEIAAYPNPTYDRLTLRRNEATKDLWEVSVTDFYGKTLYVFSWENQYLYADLTTLAAGTYLVDILKKDSKQPLAHFKIQKLSNQ